MSNPYMTEFSPDNNSHVYQIKDKEAAPIDLLKDTVGWTGKNLLNNTATSQTINGVTFTVNNDGSVTANGTATANTSFYVLNNKTWNYDGEAILSGCPANGSDNSFRCQIYDYSTSQSYLDYGTGATLPASVYGHSIDVFIRIANGYTASNLTFSPMIRKASIVEPTYEPYHTSVKQTLRDAEVIEGKNLLDYPNGTRQLIGNDGTITDNADIYCSDYIDIGGLSSIIFSCDSTVGEVYSRLAFYTSAKVFISRNTGGVFPYTQTVPSNAKYVRVCIEDTSAGKFVNPMLRSSEESDPTYEPYYIPLKDSKFDRAEQRVLGAKNLLKYPYYHSNRTSASVTYTDNGDGSITANGTATGDNSSYVLWDKSQGFPDELKNIPLIITGGLSADCRLQLWKTGGVVAKDEGNGATFVIDDSVLNATNWSIAIFIPEGKTVSNVTIKPMLRLASDSDNTYVPYAMTNKELTDELTVQDVELTLDDTTNIALQNNKSVRQGNVVCVRSQINIKSAKSAGSIILKATAKHTQYGGAVLIDTNSENKYNLVAVEQTTGIVSFICKTSIPVGWYAITYTWIEK